MARERLSSAAADRDARRVARALQRRICLRCHRDSCGCSNVERQPGIDNAPQAHRSVHAVNSADTMVPRDKRVLFLSLRESSRFAAAGGTVDLPGGCAGMLQPVREMPRICDTYLILIAIAV
jgi:hypothetical protein